jgi:hypothetical protein
MLTFALLSQCQTFNGEVIALGTTGSEYYFLSVGSNKLGYLIAGMFHSFPCGITPAMKTGWVTKVLSQKGQHRITNLREKGSSCGII